MSITNFIASSQVYGLPIYAWRIYLYRLLSQVFWTSNGWVLQHLYAIWIRTYRYMSSVSFFSFLLYVLLRCCFRLWNSFKTWWHHCLIHYLLIFNSICSYPFSVVPSLYLHNILDRSVISWHQILGLKYPIQILLILMRVVVGSSIWIYSLQNLDRFFQIWTGYEINPKK